MTAKVVTKIERADAAVIDGLAHRRLGRHDLGAAG
jgi:hypothetical protein